MIIQTRYSLFDVQYRFTCLPVVEINEQEQEALKTILQIIAKNNNCTIYELTVLSNQIHMLFTMPITQSLKKIINVLKGHSSFLMRKHFTRLKEYPTFWTRSYFIATVGELTEQRTAKIIRRLQNKSKR